MVLQAAEGRCRVAASLQPMAVLWKPAALQTAGFPYPAMASYQATNDVALGQILAVERSIN